MDTQDYSNDLDLLAAEIVEEIDCLAEEINLLLAPPTQNVPTQPARVSDAMWDLLTTVPSHTFVPPYTPLVPNHTFVPPYPPRVNPPIQHFFMREALLGSSVEAQLNAQFDDAVADLVAGLRALAPPLRALAPPSGDAVEGAD